MKKVIILLESVRFDDEIFHLISALNNIEPLSLTAVFLSPVDYTSIWAFPVVPGSAGATVIPGTKEADDLLKSHINRFSAKCRESGINFTIHNDVNGIVFEQVKLESRFADLMIIDTGSLDRKSVG